RSFATISSGLYRFLAIAVLLDVKDIPQVGPLQWGWIKRLPRMADFAKWGAACEGAFWPAGTFEAAYDDNQRGANDAVLDADDVALAVKAFMLSRLQWEGTHGRFREELEAHRFGEDRHRPKGWPPTVNVMSSRLRQAATSLRRARIEVEFSRSGKRRDRKIKIRTVPEAEDEHSDNCQNSLSASSAPPSGSENHCHGSNLLADNDFARPFVRPRPPGQIRGGR